jgi:adenylate kinase
MARAAVIIFGPPGSGKGTQAVLLAERLGLPHISTGDILRAHVAAGDEMGREVQAIMRSGKLVPDELVNRIVRERIRKPDCAEGFILDGYPRTLQQAEILAGWLKEVEIEPVVVDLAVDFDVIVKRITARRQCPVCGAVYNLVSNPPKRDLLCDRDGAALQLREDDREPVVRKRFAAYDEQTAPLLDYFRSSGYRFHVVDGNHGSPESIADEISGLIGQTVRR